MKISTRGFGFLFYVGLVVCLLLGSMGMPVTAQEVATPATVDLGDEPKGDEQQPESTGSKAESDSSDVEVPTVSTDSVDSATDDGPMYSSADATILNSADWLTVYTPTGTVSPETKRTYDFTITNLRTVDSTLQVDIWVPRGARVIIPERYNAFYSCVPWGAAVSCLRQTLLTPGNFTNFTFDVALADSQNPAICPSLIELDVAFLVGGMQRTVYADTITPTCPVQTTQPKVEANVAIKDGADQTVTRPATVGDSISYQMSVTNPDTEPMTISSFSKAIPPELVSLGWSVYPNTSLSPGGPCVFDNGTFGCSSVQLVGGETFTVELQSGAIPESYEDCGTFTSSAIASGGLTRSAVSVTIECPPKFVIFPEINLGSFACEGSVSIIPMTSTSGDHIESMTVNQGLTDLTPTSGSTYEVKSGIPVRITFREADGAFWPSPLPNLVDGGSWELVNDAQVFTFTPTQGDCAPYFQVTQTWVDANGNSIAGEPRLAPGSDLYIQVQVKNTGVSTITGLSYESILPTELRPITDQVRPPGDTTDNGQRCSTVTAEIMNSGVIYTMWSGKRCSLLQPNALQPGDSLSFQVWARVPNNPTASQCTSGISTGASVTSVNNASVTIPGPAMTVSIVCGTEPEVPTALRVKIELTSGTSLEGAPWKLYAPVASQISQPIYDQGIVGPDNLIVFNLPTPPGSYRLVIEPPGMDVIDRVFETSDSATEITLQIDDEVENETPTPSPTPSPTTPGAGTTPEPSATTVPSEPVGVVTSLPNTGTGDGSGSILLLITGLTAVTLSLMSFGVLRKDSAR